MKGMCVEKVTAASHEKQIGVYWKINSFLEEVFLLLPDPVH
jgi:hypothetical protein